MTTHGWFAEVREVLVSAAVVEGRRRQEPAGDQSHALDRILGATLVAAHAGESISEVSSRWRAGSASPASPA